jgi:precorrin-2 methylase
VKAAFNLTDLRKYDLVASPRTPSAARAWLKRLAHSPLAFHLDDDTSEVLHTWDQPAFTRSVARHLSAGRNAVFRILGEKRTWSLYGKHSGV